MSPKVSFIVIGVQKAGTTALFDYLSDHPGLNLSTVKEAHFFDDESLDWSNPDYGLYHRRFDPGRPGPMGEATPIYIYWPDSLERIRAYNPQVRLVLMLRDPVERAFSHWRMETARGVERAPFAWCIREGRRRLFDAEPWGHHREFSYVERGYYGEQVERLFALFPRDQVLFLQQEALRADPNAALAQVSRFVGVEPPPPVAPRQVHVGQKIGGLDPADAAYLRDLYAADQARLAKLMSMAR